MSGLSVPELRRKLQMLVACGAYPNVRAVADALGKSPITLRGWANGASGQPLDTVPQQNVDALIELFAGVLPELLDDQIRRLLSGPADDLEQLISAGAETSLQKLIALEADRNAGSLFVEEKGLGLVRRAQTDGSQPHFSVQLGQPFRIEFATRARGGFAMALQSAPGGWGSVPAKVDRSCKCIHLPGAEVRNEDAFVIEENEVGRHQFFAAQASKPFPKEFAEAARNGVPLDRTLLAHFERHYLAQDRSSRRLFAVEIAFTPPA